MTKKKKKIKYLPLERVKEADKYDFTDDDLEEIHKFLNVEFSNSYELKKAALAADNAIKQIISIVYQDKYTLDQFCKMMADDPELTDGVMRKLSTIIAAKKWKKNKQVYLFDEDLIKDFDNSTSCVLVKDAWDYLPYPTFVIEFKKEVYGFKYFIVDITKENIRVRKKLLFNIYKTVSSKEAYMMTIQTISTNGYIGSAITCVPNQSTTITYDNNASEKERLFNVIAQAINYLISAKPDILPKRASKVTKSYDVDKVIENQNKVRKWEVGFRYGSAIRKYEQEQKRKEQDINSTSGNKSGIKKRPHRRAGHWSHYWYGSKSDPDKRECRPVWLSPCYVNVAIDTNNVIEGDVIFHKVY